METRYRNIFDRGWRRFGTGLSFLVFGAGGALISVTVFPFLRLISPRKSTARRRIALAMHRAMGLFIWFMRTLRLFDYEIHGRDRLLKPGQLVVANHPTLIDVVFLLSLIPDAGCVVKRGLWHNPFLRWPVLWGGYIPNSEGPELVPDCARCLNDGRSLLIFPEGTRSVPGRPLLLKRGAAQIALAAGVDLLPVTIACEPSCLTKGSHWYQVPARAPRFTITVGQPIPVRQFGGASQSPAIAARHLTQYLTAHFTRGIESHCELLGKNAPTFPPGARSVSL